MVYALPGKKTRYVPVAEVAFRYVAYTSVPIFSFGRDLHTLRVYHWAALTTKTWSLGCNEHSRDVGEMAPDYRILLMEHWHSAPPAIPSSTPTKTPLTIIA